MLDFANRPPQAPEDITLSQIGEGILIRAASKADPDAIDLLGQSACSEIFDAIEGELTYGEMGELATRVLDQATEILGEKITSFREGMDGIFVQVTS